MPCRFVAIDNIAFHLSCMSNITAFIYYAVMMFSAAFITIRLEVLTDRLAHYTI